MGSNYLQVLQTAFRSIRPEYDQPVAILKEAEEKGFLFHGSPEGNLKVLRPSHSPVMGGRPVVFAGRAWMAVSCTAKWNDDAFAQGTVNGEPYMEAREPNAFARYKDGGWVYAVSPASFEWDSRLTRFEFISKKPVEVLWGIYIKNPFYTMESLGVKLKP